jgi:surfeit locus 1 family protein
MIRQLFSREWIVTTILVVIGSALCFRLGIWQLDRLEQRREFNAHFEAMQAAEPLELPEQSGEDLVSMEYRQVCASGTYDFEHQVGLRNQYWQDRYGYHLLTPLVMSDGWAVLIDRGWIPADGINDSPADWRKYDLSTPLEVCGIIRPGGERPAFGGQPDPTLAPDQIGLDFWNNVNLERIEDQLPYPLLKVYIQPDEDEGDDEPPVPFQPEVEISEGPHLGYAGQWFTFSALLLFGYPFYVRRKENTNE